MCKRSSFFQNSWFMWKRIFFHENYLQTLNFIYNSVYILFLGENWSYIICCEYMYIDNIYICISLYLQTIISFYAAYI